MTGRDFLNAVGNCREDILATLLAVLEGTKAAYCVIGGLGVNAYVEPVVSLDLDVVVVADQLEEVCPEAEKRGLKVERFEHSVNLTSRDSDLRVQLQTDARYQAFLARAETREVLGYRLAVAALEDVLQGKLWAYSDPTGRRSKRQKDLADILRLLECYPALGRLVPPEIAAELDK
jgi:hypothetical protein